ncbi:Uridylate kinase [Yarrowia sp. B02]|nr:Uridylate kinase [Yarrowia sp. B02]
MFRSRLSHMARALGRMSRPTPLARPYGPPELLHNAMPTPVKLVIAFGATTAFFMWAAKQLDKKPQAVEMTEADYNELVQHTKSKYKKAAFGPNEVSVIFVLGGPGAGKGTQCAKLVDEYGFVHLSAGDLLRAEQTRPNSQYGKLIADCIKAGSIVPQEVTIGLLKNAMKESVAEGKTRFLVDGFPRKMDQALKFEEDVAVSKFTLFFECPEEVMLKRLLKRGETSGRTDDNIESIRKRFVTFIETSMPVVDYFETQDRVVVVDCKQDPDVVYSNVKDALHARGIYLKK